MERIQQLPLFLLQTVLFPEQRLPLRVFETRYMDMVSACLKNEKPFGIVLIRNGGEVGEIAEPERVGTLAYIEKWEMPQAGLLHILVRGDRRFRIEDTAHSGRLVRADISLWGHEKEQAIPPEFADMAEFVRAVIRDFDPQLIAKPHRYEDASWVGMRLAHLLPVEARLKQAWLEEQDPVARLKSIKETLDRMAVNEDQP
jgi:hypothetical protein